MADITKEEISRIYDTKERIEARAQNLALYSEESPKYETREQIDNIKSTSERLQSRALNIDLYAEMF